MDKATLQRVMHAACRSRHSLEEGCRIDEGGEASTFLVSKSLMADPAHQRFPREKREKEKKQGLKRPQQRKNKQTKTTDCPSTYIDPTTTLTRRRRSTDTERTPQRRRIRTAVATDG